MLWHHGWDELVRGRYVLDVLYAFLCAFHVDTIAYSLAYISQDEVSVI